MLHIVLADGFEEIEALATIDILRRCGLEVQIISVTGKRLMVGAHNIPVQADTLLRVSDMNQTEGIICLEACQVPVRLLRAIVCARPSERLIEAESFWPPFVPHRWYSDRWNC